MSAICAMVQRHAVHMMTDGLTYFDGVPLEVDRRKAYLIDGMLAAIACTGPALLGEHLATRLQDFGSFDALAAHGSQAMGDAFREYVAEHRNGDAIANLVVAGWHERDNRPALYAMNLETDGEKLAWSRKYGRSGSSDEEAAFELMEVDCTSIPCPSAAEFKVAGYDLAAPLDGKDACTDMLHIMEMQRRMQFDGRYLVGGEVTMTTITAQGITQRVVHRWSEDQVGETIQPRPIDWRAWQNALRAAS